AVSGTSRDDRPADPGAATAPAEAGDPGFAIRGARTVIPAGKRARLYNIGNVASADQSGLPVSGNLGPSNGWALPISSDVQPIRDRRDPEIRPLARRLAGGAADLSLPSIWRQRV